MTVSRVLNNQSDRFSEETRQRVLQAVRDLEYAPVAQPITQSRNAKTRVLGLVFDGTPVEGYWGLPTFWGLSEAALENDYDLLTMWRVNPPWMGGQEELRFLDRRSDGFIFIAPVNRRPLLETLTRHKLPLVTCFTSHALAGVSCVLLDNADAMRQCVCHLAALRHTRILHISPPNERSDFCDRRLGYVSAMELLGLEPLVLEANDFGDPEQAAGLLEQIHRHGITAIAAATDGLALGVWDVLTENGFSVPRDISITGMDDLAQAAQRGLSSVHYSCEEVGRQAARIIINLINGGESTTENTIVPVELIQRASVAPPAT